MKSIVDPDIYKLALRVRKLVERWSIKSIEIEYSTLKRGCAIASYTLWKAYEAAGIKSNLVVVEGEYCHCWVEIDNWTVDITATQFSKWTGPVTITSSTYKMERGDSISYNLKAVERISEWDTQSPFVYNKQIKRLVKRIQVEYGLK